MFQGLGVNGFRVLGRFKGLRLKLLSGFLGLRKGLGHPKISPKWTKMGLYIGRAKTNTSPKGPLQENSGTGKPDRFPATGGGFQPQGPKP